MKQKLGPLVMFLPYILFQTVRFVELAVLRNLFREQLTAQGQKTTMLILLISASLNVILFAGWYYKEYAAEKKEKLFAGTNGNLMILTGIIGILLQVSGTLLLTGILSLVPDMSVQYESTISILTMLNPVALCYTGAVAPILEECVFRGLILRYGEESLSFAAANILQAALFGLYHGNKVQAVYAFLLGMFIGYLVHVTGSLMTGMVFHISFNLIGIIFSDISCNQLPVYLLFVLGSVLVALCVWLVIRLKRQCMQQLHQPH